MIGIALLLAIWDATLGRLFGRKRGRRLHEGEQVVIQGRLIGPGGRVDDRGFLCLSLREGIALAGDRLGAYRREQLPWMGEVVQANLRDLRVKGVPLAWQALRLADDDSQYLVCEPGDVALVKAASARRRLDK